MNRGAIPTGKKHVCPDPRCGRRFATELGLLKHRRYCRGRRPKEGDPYQTS